RVSRINKDTNELQVLLTFATLQSDTSINLSQWYDIFVYAAQVGIPETLFIVAQIQVSVNSAYVNTFAIIAFNTVTGLYNVLGFSGNNSSDSIVAQEWLTNMAAETPKLT